MQQEEINEEVPSILKLLRALAPKRAMTMAEAFQIAEQQADWLLDTFGIQEGPVPSEIVSELPRVQVILDPDLPTSGLSHWNGQVWLIILNRCDSRERRRFTLMHEFKHILDHGAPALIPHGHQWRDAAEQVADFFAGCLLMPRRLVERAWRDAQPHPTALARAFEVSTTAMTYRLRQLGLVTASRHYPHQVSDYDNERSAA